MKLEKPTVFMTIKELREAVDYGYVNSTYGYNKSNIFPTVLWKKDGRITHQPNSDEEENNYWSNEKIIRIIQQSVLWADIREQYKPKKWYEGNFKEKYPNEVLCYVSNSFLAFSEPRIVIYYLPGSNHPFVTGPAEWPPNKWITAEPIPPDEAPEIIGQEEEEGR